MEVEDVHAAAEWACQQPGISNVNNFIFGGSHGGFIAAHLIARYPDFYRGAALRNPVTDIGAMISDTDIPDWCYAEAGIDFNPSKPNFQVENYSKLYGMSPISRIKERVSPALLMLGEDDRRVPPSQGKRWAEKLIGNGHSVTTLMFPDTGHALDSVDAERYGFEACSAFFIFNLR